MDISVMTSKEKVKNMPNGSLNNTFIKYKSFLPTILGPYLKNNDICKAIRFANKCASWAVSQRGVVSVNLKDVSE